MREQCRIERVHWATGKLIRRGPYRGEISKDHRAPGRSAQHQCLRPAIIENKPVMREDLVDAPHALPAMAMACDAIALDRIE